MCLCRDHLKITVTPMASSFRRQFLKLLSTIVTERMNQTIEEHIQCMLAHAKLLKSLLCEALMTGVDIINRSPTFALMGDVPLKVGSGRDNSYKQFRVFGCKTFVHIPKVEHLFIFLQAFMNFFKL